MKLFTIIAAGAMAIGAALATSATQAADLKIGVIAPLTGPLASHGTQIKQGIELYLKQHGDVVAGRKVEVLYKDTGGIAPATAKREAQELLIHNKVDVLAGFVLTPNAFAAAPLATDFKVPMVVMTAATSSLTQKSPYIVRTSMTMPASAAAIAQWAYHRDGIRKAYVLVSDYAPGVDWEKQFQHTFTELGGTLVGDVRAPVNTVDYSPYLERARNAHPDGLFMFVPGGQTGVALIKSVERAGLKKAGIKLLGPGDMMDEAELQSYGDGAEGYVTAFQYSAAHASPANREFVAAFAKAYPGQQPNYVVVGAYDGMHLIYAALAKTEGDSQAAAFLKAVEGMKWESPRGPVEIDAKTRDIVQNEYIRRTARVGGQLQNTEFFVYGAVKDPGKLDGRFEYSGSGDIKP